MSVLEGREEKDSSERQSLWAQPLITPVTSYEKCDCRAFMTALGWVTNMSTTCLLLKTSLISSRKEALPCNSFMKLHTQCTNTVYRTGDTSFFFLLFDIIQLPVYSFLTTVFELHTAILIEAGALFRFCFSYLFGKWISGKWSQAPLFPLPTNVDLNKSISWLKIILQIDVHAAFFWNSSDVNKNISLICLFILCLAELIKQISSGSIKQFRFS